MKRRLAGTPFSLALYFMIICMCWQAVFISGSTHCVPQPLEQHFSWPSQSSSAEHSLSQLSTETGTKYGHCPDFNWCWTGQQVPSAPLFSLWQENPSGHASARLRGLHWTVRLSAGLM